MSASLSSASGLRPAGAFVALGAMLAVVAARSLQIALAAEGVQPASERVAEVERPVFEIADASGIPLAVTVESYRLELSPNACWQSHTPAHLAALVSEALGGDPTPAALLACFLPDARRGVVALDGAELELDGEQAAALHRWLKAGDLSHVDSALEGSGRPLAGMWLEPVGRPEPGAERYAIRWEPARVLSAETRFEQGFAASSPAPWARRLADALSACLGPDWPRGRGPRPATDAERRERVWGALCPTRYKVVLQGIEPREAARLNALFEAERVHPHQIALARSLERRYPVQGLDPRRDSDGRGTGADAPPFEVLGRWGTYDPAVAERIARIELDLDPDAPPSPELESRKLALVHRPSALWGLERLADRLLRRPELGFLELEGERYRFFATQPVRQPLRRLFRDVEPASEVPRVHTTLLAALGRTTRRVLEGVMEEHDPALAMAIVVDLESGNVLALDALDAYETSGFTPILHAFTPGSTFKVVTMTVALDAGVVRPDDRFETYDGHFVFQGRPIGEAEGNPIGTITASQALAESCNAVLTQIGTRVPAPRFRGKLVELGYGRRPESGLGPERAGLLTSLPWVTRYTHASVCFGHEISTTLWQHATALAAILRGGELLPLRLVDGIEQGGSLHALERPARRRVFPETVCNEVRAMMVRGAREGTGRFVARDDLAMGTKTGTSEKVSTEVCLHVELAHEAEHHCGGKCRSKLVGEHGHRRRNCYTSSMVAFGRLPEGGREVMVLVVVDEPRGKLKFGAEVAGKAAVALLADALGRTRDGREVEPLPVDGFVPCTAEPGPLSFQPWAEGAAW